MLSRTNLTGFYEYVADVQYGFGLAMRLLLTGREALAVATLPDLHGCSTQSVPIDQAKKGDTVLMKLPLEIRENIYRHVLGEQRWHITEPKTWSAHTFCLALGDPSGFYLPFGDGHSLLRANKQIRREALPIAYQGTTVQTDDIDCAAALLLAIGRIGRRNITNFILGWESYADTQMNWSKPQISDIHLTLPRLHVSTCISLLKQCLRLTDLSLSFDNVLMSDMPLLTFQSDPGIRLCCSIQNLKRVNIIDLVGETLEDEAAAKWLKDALLSG